MKEYFINEAIEKAIKDYLLSKSDQEGKLYNSFLVVFIRALCLIYGELDIINPYYTNNSDMFKYNLKRYNCPLGLIDNLMLLIDMYYKIEMKNQNSLETEENRYFIEVQKKLVDLFVSKIESFEVSDNEYKEFFDLLYTPATSNPLRQSYNYLKASNPYEVAIYYQEKINNIHKQNKKIEQKELLDLDVYKLFNYKLSDISKMNNEEIKNLNKSIYQSLNINDNAINKDYLLKEAINKLKYNDTNRVGTGNGYVDILIVMSIIVTSIMVVSIFAFIVF